MAIEGLSEVSSVFKSASTLSQSGLTPKHGTCLASCLYRSSAEALYMS